MKEAEAFALAKEALEAMTAIGIVVSVVDETFTMKRVVENVRLMADNLTATQARCTELLLENRELKQGSNGWMRARQAERRLEELDARFPPEPKEQPRWQPLPKRFTLKP